MFRHSETIRLVIDATRFLAVAMAAGRLDLIWINPVHFLRYSHKA